MVISKTTKEGSKTVLRLGKGGMHRLKVEESFLSFAPVGCASHISLLLKRTEGAERIFPDEDTGTDAFSIFENRFEKIHVFEQILLI